MAKESCMSTERYDRGWQKLKEIDGEAGERVIESLADIAPEFARYLIEFPFGDIYSRPGLDLKSRENATIAALAAMGTARTDRAHRPHSHRGYQFARRVQLPDRAVPAPTATIASGSKITCSQWLN